MPPPALILLHHGDRVRWWTWIAGARRMMFRLDAPYVYGRRPAPTDALDETLQAWRPVYTVDLRTRVAVRVQPEPASEPDTAFQHPSP